MFNRESRQQPRPGGAEYGVQQEYHPQPAPPSARPVPPGYGQPAEAVTQQMSGLLDALQQPGQPPAPVDPNEVVFSRPYLAHGNPVSRITLRRPTTREIKKCGVPIKVVADGNGRIVDMEMKWDAVAAYIPLLSTPPLPPSTVDELDFFDLDACGAVLAPFFVRLAPSGT